MKHFAYGSNMETGHLIDRVGEIKDLGKATLRGYELRFSKLGDDGSGKANVHNSNRDSSVEGVLYELDEEQFDKLDYCEGAKTGHYSRESLKNIQTNKGRSIEAEVYIANREKINNNLKPTKKYLSYLIEGASEPVHKLSNSYIEFLKSHEIQGG